MHIELHAVSKRFGQTLALDEISMTIAPGRIVAVLGENGAGKSTLLRILAGVSVPDAGSVKIEGEEFNRTRMDLRRQMVFTPDVPVLFGDDTVVRNVAAFAHFYHVDTSGRETQIASFMEDCGVAELAQRRVSGLSRGQAWKVAMACVCAVRPGLWLVDEPYASGMDAIGIAAFKRLVRDLAASGSTVIYTTQMIDLAATFADEVVVIRRGKLVGHHTGKEIQSLLVTGESAGEAILEGNTTPAL